MNEVAHSLDVTAATLYEAVAQALATLRGHEWVGEIGKGMTTVTVKVRQPEVTHIVKVQDFEEWLNRQGRTPAEVILKARLRQSSGARPLMQIVDLAGFPAPSRPIPIRDHHHHDHRRDGRQTRHHPHDSSRAPIEAS